MTDITEEVEYYEFDSQTQKLELVHHVSLADS